MFILKINTLFFTFRRGWCWKVRQRGLPLADSPEGSCCRPPNAPPQMPEMPLSLLLLLAKQPCMTNPTDRPTADGNSGTSGLGAGLKRLPGLRLRQSPHWGRPPVSGPGALDAGDQHVHGGGHLDLLKEHVAPRSPGAPCLGRSLQQVLGVLQEALVPTAAQAAQR